MKKYLTAIVPAAVIALVLAPSFAHALYDLDDVFAFAQNVLNKIVPILIAFMIVLFVWGVVQYSTAKDEEKQEKARGFIISTIIGLAAIILIWGIVRVIANTLELDNSVPTEDFPCTPNPELGIYC